MVNSSFVVSRVILNSIHKNQFFNCLTKITKNQYFVDPTAHISAYDKAEIDHESSLKSSVSEFEDGLTSFQDFMVFMPVKVQFRPCPLCNSFSQSRRHV